MKFFTKKMMSFLLIIAIILTGIPAETLAASQSVTVSTKEDLMQAIEDIEGSGVITIENLNADLSPAIYFENKDITFNLVNSNLSTSEGPVIFAFGGNITINADDNSSMTTNEHTGNMGVVRIDNDKDYDFNTSTFPTKYALTINGGRYTCSDTAIWDEDREIEVYDSVFTAAPGVEVTINNAICNGKVEPVNFEGVGITEYGKLIINGGKFKNDVKNYITKDKVCWKAGNYYYVKNTEFSDAFKSVFPDSKITFNAVKPEADNEYFWLLIDYINNQYNEKGFSIYSETFSSDFSKCTVIYHEGEADEEAHDLDIVWNYNTETNTVAQKYVDKFPQNREWFEVSDLELINYFLNLKPGYESEYAALPNYSGELRKITDNINFELAVDVRGGSDDPFVSESIGEAKFLHNGVIYYVSSGLGAKGEHAIYVPENTGDSANALIAAAQKRIDDFAGKGKATITLANESVTEFYNRSLAEYDAILADAQNQVATLQTDVNALYQQSADLNTQYIIAEQEGNTDEMERLSQEISAVNSQISEKNFQLMDFEEIVASTPANKQYLVDSFASGDYKFLNDAAGGYLFDVKINGYTYQFVIIKDNDKMVTPEYKTVDLETKVEISADASSVPLDTIISAEKLTSGSEYDRIIKALDIDSGEMYDLNLYSNTLGENITKLDNGKFQVKIPIPAELKGKTLVVYYVDANGKITPYDVTPEGEYAVFETDHFSIYTLAEKTDTTVPVTGDNNMILLWGSLVLAAITGGLAIRRKRVNA